MSTNNIPVVQRPPRKVKTVKNPNGISPVYGIPTVNRFDGGGKLTYQLWENITGTPWKTARKSGLTTGTYAENIKLRNRLINEGNVLENARRDNFNNETPLEPINTPVDNRTYPNNKLLRPANDVIPQLTLSNELAQPAAIPSKQRPDNLQKINRFTGAPLEMSVPELSGVKRGYSPQQKLQLRDSSIDVPEDGLMLGTHRERYTSSINRLDNKYLPLVGPPIMGLTNTKRSYTPISQMEEKTTIPRDSIYGPAGVKREYSPISDVNPISAKLKSFTDGLSLISRAFNPATNMTPISSVLKTPDTKLAPVRDPYVKIDQLEGKTIAGLDGSIKGLSKIKIIESPTTQKPILSTKEVVENKPTVKLPTVNKPMEKQKVDYSLPPDVRDVVNKKSTNPRFETYDGKYYVLSKENSQIYVFNKDHKLIDTTIAGRGKAVGDKPNTATMASKTPGSHAYTRSGSAVISEVETDQENIQSYGTPFNRIKYNDVWASSEGLGLHGIYKTEYAFRKAILDNPKVIDKLMSWGCINVPKDFLLKQNTKPAVGDSVFITREPVRNLPLIAQKTK